MKKQARKSKGKAARPAGSAGPLAVLYRLDAGTQRGDAVRSTLTAQGVRVKTATEDMLGDPVGALVGLVGFRRSPKPYSGAVPETEFMLFNNVTGQRLTDVLAAMREADCSVACKAQVTQHNRLWPLATLITEVSREHEAMTASSSGKEAMDR